LGFIFQRQIDLRSNIDEKNKGFALAFGSALVLSLTAIFIRHLTQAYVMPALVLAYWREVFTAAGLFVFFLVRNPRLIGGVKGHGKFLTGYGLVLAVFNALWTLSVSLNGAAVATVLAYSSAGFAVLLGWLILREPLTIKKILAAVMSLTGCALVVDALNPDVWQINMVGMGAGIAAGIFYALYSIMGRAASEKGLNTWTTLMVIFAIASVFMLCFNVFSFGVIPGAAETPADILWPGGDWTGWLILFILAIGPTLMGYGLYNAALQHLESSITNLIVTIEPVFTAVIAYFLFGERFSATQVGGAVLIMSAVLVLRIKRKSQRS
jgi:drug/metabolite transporter (DMT)-like permease